MEPATEALLGRLKALADPTRLRLLALCRQGECSVSELTAVLRQSQPRVSQHLKQLVEAGVIEREQRGRFAFYALQPGALERIAELVRPQPVPA